MTEAVERRGFQQPVIDIPSVVRRTQSGDADAASELYGYLQGRLTRFFSRRLPNEADDLAQETLLEISVALPKFVSRREDVFAKQFTNWTFAIARSFLNTELRRVIGQRTTPLDENSYFKFAEEKDEEPVDIATLIPRFRDRLTELLSPAELQAVDLRQSGKDLAEISNEVDGSERAIINRLYRARMKIEGDLLHPAGLRRLVDYLESPKDTSLAVAAARGGLTAIKYLGLWYTTDEWIKRYSPRRVIASQSMVDQGYLLLSENTTPDEYGTLLGFRYQEIITRHRGRIYITGEGLESFRNLRRRSQRGIESPGDEFRELSTFGSNITEQQRLAKAIEAGHLTAVKHGAWWFVKPEDAINFLEAQPPIQPARLKNDESPVVRTGVIYKAAELERIPEEDSPEAFSAWFFNIAKLISDQRLPWSKRKLLLQPDNLDELTNIIVTQFDGWLERKGIEMYPSIKAIAVQRLKGKRATDIAREIGWTDQSVTTSVSIARRLIEGNLIYPAGIARVSSFKEQALEAAAVAGRLEAVWFMGKWYTTQEKVQAYKGTKI